MRKNIWHRIGGYLAAGLALAACPCHLIVTLPLFQPDGRHGNRNIPWAEPLWRYCCFNHRLYHRLDSGVPLVGEQCIGRCDALPKAIPDVDESPAPIWIIESG